MLAHMVTNGASTTAPFFGWVPVEALSLLNYALIAAFATFLMWVLFGWKHDIEMRLVANRRIPFWTVGLWMSVAFTWGTTYLYTASLAYEQGLLGFCVFAFGNTMGLVLPMVFSGRIPAPQEKYSWAGFMRGRFGARTGGLSAVSSMSVLVFHALSLQFIVATLVLKSVWDLDPAVSIAGAAAVMLLMMALGGICSSVSLDILKGGMMIALIAYLAPQTVISAGGFDAIVGGLSGVVGVPGAEESRIVFLLTEGVAIIVSLTTAGMMDQALFQRYFSVNQATRRLVFFVMTAGVVLFVFNMVASGALGALAANPWLNIEVRPGQSGIAGFLAMEKFVPFIAPYFILTIVVSFFASGDAALNASTSVLIADVVRPRWPHLSDRELWWVQMCAATIFIIPPALIAYSGATLIGIIVAVGVFRAPFLFPTIFGIVADERRLPDVFWAIVLAMVVGGGLYTTGAVCAMGPKVLHADIFAACTSYVVPHFSTSALKFTGSIAGWTITLAYCLWMLCRPLRMQATRRVPQLPEEMIKKK